PPCIGRIARFLAGRLEVDFPGNTRGPIEARTTIQLTPTELAEAIAEQRPAVLLFENGDKSLPILIGLIQTEARPLVSLDALRRTESTPTVAQVDGHRVVLEGQHEVVLRCGKALITLRQDGRVTIRGVQVTTEASGTHRIRGGKVSI